MSKAKKRIRRRAYDLYCRRSNAGCALDDWTRAENEASAAPIASIADEGNEIRITACVPNVNAADVAIDVLPEEIVIETNRNGEIERYKRLRLGAAVDMKRVEAHMQGSELDVIAPKAKTKKT